jgi:hypothetical protein
MPLNNFVLTIIGAGALGSEVLQKISGRGFGVVRVIDGDIVTEKNKLNQPLYSGVDTSNPVYKSDAIVSLLSNGSKTNFVSVPEYVGEKRASSLIGGSSMVLDFTDNTFSRLVINQACVEKGIPLLIASVNEKEGFYYIIDKGACFNCLYRNLSGKIKEGCYGAPLHVPDNFSSMIADAAESFFNGAVEGDWISLSFIDGRVTKTAIKKDDMCEVCSLHEHKPIKADGFIQICGDGIKFSLQRDINLKTLFGGEPGAIIENGICVIKSGTKSILLSSAGDVLFTGYSEQEARKFISERLFGA